LKGEEYKVASREREVAEQLVKLAWRWGPELEIHLEDATDALWRALGLPRPAPIKANGVRLHSLKTL